MEVLALHHKRKFNVVSTCSYGNTPDPVEMDTEWKKALTEISKEKELSKTEQELAKQNWYLLEGKRFFVQNSYDFTIETVGVYENRRIVFKAIEIINEKLQDVNSKISDGTFAIEQSETTLRNGYDIKLEDYDYTIGKIIEYMLYETYYLGDKSLTCCFKDTSYDSYDFTWQPLNQLTVPIISMIQRSTEMAIDFKTIIDSLSKWKLAIITV